MAKIDREFKKLVEIIYGTGYEYDDPYRKGVKRIEIPTYTFKHDLTESFPAITTKELWMKGVVGELLWFLKGNTNIKYLDDNKIYIWHKDAYNWYTKNGGELDYKSWKLALNCDLHEEFGDLGRVYGTQWREFNGVNQWDDPTHVDQIDRLIKGMKERPLATDLLVNAWNPAELDKMALPPCHFGFQVVGRPLMMWERIELCEEEVYYDGDSTTEGHEKFFADRNVPKYGFTLIWDQRSVDTFLGLPFNIASYALLAHILGKLTNMVPLAIEGNLRNVHLYDNSLDAVRELLERDPNKYKGINLEINETAERVLQGEKSLDEKLEFLSIGDFKLNNYECYPALKVEMLSRD